MALLLDNGRIITPAGTLERGWLSYHDGLISGLNAGLAPQSESLPRLDVDGLTILPGFIDIHVHGALGHEAMDANPDGLRAMAAFYAKHGVTSFLATTWTDSHARILAALQTIAAVRGRIPHGATLLGAHLEGPYLNPEKCGAQNAAYIRQAMPDEAHAYLDVGVIRLLALAPEYPQNHWLIAECAKRGLTVSAAHTSAVYEEMVAAYQLGLRHATHLFNAMGGLGHRHVGTVGAVLGEDGITCELIADTIHVHPIAMKIAYRSKGAEKLALISDAVRPTGLPEGEYAVDGTRKIWVKDGAVRLHDGTLAGSILTLDVALHNLIQATGETLEKLWPTVSLTPARAIGLAERKGSLEVGKDADIVVVDDNLHVHLTIAEGQIVYKSERFAYVV
jgi:N-acetylglucosamine-6-phosphate deacetylase